jgi:hypothetical protein
MKTSDQLIMLKCCATSAGRGSKKHQHPQFLFDVGEAVWLVSGNENQRAGANRLAAIASLERRPAATTGRICAVGV